MKVSDFDYTLPEELIAQEPLARRDASRLMVLGREGGGVEHRLFAELPELLDPGDLLVLNDTRVLPARLLGRKPSGGKVEVLLLEQVGNSGAAPLWRCLLSASRPPRPGMRLEFAAGLSARVERREGDTWTVRLEDPSSDPAGKLEKVGRAPLPPYIRRQPDDPRLARDRERYQTVFARRPGSSAAPTAGLHFSPEILRALEVRGVRLAFVTLHVGLGTFLPVRVERVEDHVMHAEAFHVPEATASAVKTATQRGGRVVAVGTTVIRSLEASAMKEGFVRPGSGRCDLFIYPGFRFRVVDALLTNFHLPRSTLLMLVSAFAGRENVLAAYEEAIRQRYRFYSYGDAMLLKDG